MLLALVPLFMACQSTLTDDTQSVGVEMSGDFLVEGPNTLQGNSGISLEALAEAVGCSPEGIIAIGVSSVSVGIQEDGRAIAESLLFQVASSNQDLISIATLNPLPESGKIEMQVAEEVDLLPYMQDEGLTWVMDLNLSEDYMDELMAKAKIGLIVEYKEEK